MKVGDLLVDKNDFNEIQYRDRIEIIDYQNINGVEMYTLTNGIEVKTLTKDCVNDNFIKVDGEAEKDTRFFNSYDRLEFMVGGFYILAFGIAILIANLITKG